MGSKLNYTLHLTVVTISFRLIISELNLVSSSNVKGSIMLDLPYPLSLVYNSAHIRKVKSEIVSHGPLSITIFLHCLADPSIPFSSVTEYALLENCFKSRPVSIPLALGDLRHVFVSSKVVGKTAHKIIFPENGLPFDPLPDRLFPYPPAHEQGSKQHTDTLLSDGCLSG